MSPGHTILCGIAVFALVIIGGQLRKIADTLQAAHAEQMCVVLAQPQSKCNLPCKCAPLYDLGTDEWINCMGVGRVYLD